MRLGNNRLSGPIPPEIGNLVKLQTLSLSENQLSETIPAQLDNLVNLQELDLSSNRLSGALAPQWRHLVNLQNLYLQTNQLTGTIPSDLGQLTNLQKLYLSFNQLSGPIPSQLGSLTKLQDLFLAHNQLTGTVPSALGNLTNIITLTLGATQLGGPLPTSLTNLHNITSLQFGYTNLCEPRDAQFQAWLQAIPQVFGAGISCSPETGDVYEDKGDNHCDQATLITSDGEAQPHNFHTSGDNDWVKFDGSKGVHYRIEALVATDSTADVGIELYTACNALSETQAYTFTPSVRLEFTAPVTSQYFLRLTDNVSTISGAKARYNLVVRTITPSAPSTVSAVIIVAGSLGTNDSVMSNIYHASDAMRQIFIQQGYTADHITYLAPDPAHTNVNQASTKANLQAAITQWAMNLVGDNGALTLYLIDHGSLEQRFFLNKSQGEWIMPGDLDSWLDTFEAAHPNAKVNVIIEACYGGAFIRHAQVTGKNSRVVITSTTDQALAWASANGGAQFSDHLLDALSRKASLFASFQAGQAAAQAFQPSQLAWLDANGNAIPNEPEDYALAGQRGFEVIGSFASNWPPYVQTANVANSLVRATVLDDQAVAHVWAMIYPPDYSAPVTGEALIRDSDDLRITQLGLLPRSDGSYSANFAFTHPGAYRIVVYAEDNQGFEAQPVVTEVLVGPGQSLFLPLIVTNRIQ